MNVRQAILEAIRKEPGITAAALGRMSELSDSRVRRLLRRLNLELSGECLVRDEAGQIWIMEVNEARCLGAIWVGAEAGGVVQCSAEPMFPDGRCSEHSMYESAEILTFSRELAYRCGLCNPRPPQVCQLGRETLRELSEALNAITPLTLGDRLEKDRLHNILRAAEALLAWKENMRSGVREEWIPHELYERHKRSSGNPFEFGIRKHFAVLEVTPEATREEVLSAWRKLARRHHPDTTDGDEEMMKKVNLARDRIFRIRRWE